MAMLAAALSAGPSVSLDDDRRDRRPGSRAARRSARVLPPLLPSGERLARARRRHRRRRARWRWSTRTSAASTPGPKVDAVRAEASIPGEVRISLEDRVELPRLYIAWLSPAMFADGDADLDLATDLLANGKTSRLYKRLVFDERIATDVSAAQNSREIGGFVQVTATAAPGHTLRGAGARDPRRDRAPRRRRTDRRSKSNADACRPNRSSSIACRRSAASAASPISSTPTTCSSGDPGYFDRDLARYYGVNARVAAARRRALSRSRAARHAQRRAARPRRRWPLPTRRRRRSRDASIGRGCPTSGPARPFAFPTIEKSTLPNGLRVWTVRHAQVPVVAFMLLVRRGAAGDPPGKDGLAAMTADMLDEGSGDRSAIDMHEALARIGAQFDTDIGSDATLVEPHRRSAALADRGLELARRHRRAPALREARLRARAPAAPAPARAAARHARRRRRPRVRAAAVRIASLRAHADRAPSRRSPSMTIDDVRGVSRASDPAGDRDADRRRRLRARRDRAAGGRRVRRRGPAAATTRAAERAARIPHAGAPQHRGAPGRAAVRAADRTRRRRARHARLSRAGGGATWCSAGSSSAGST